MHSRTSLRSTSKSCTKVNHRKALPEHPTSPSPHRGLYRSSEPEQRAGADHLREGPSRAVNNGASRGSPLAAPARDRRRPPGPMTRATRPTIVHSSQQSTSAAAGQPHQDTRSRAGAAGRGAHARALSLSRLSAALGRRARDRLTSRPDGVRAAHRPATEEPVAAAAAAAAARIPHHSIQPGQLAVPGHLLQRGTPAF